MELNAEHIVYMALTVAAVLLGGIFAARSVKSAEGYSLGGRAAGWPLVAGSIAGTVVGGGATMGTAQLAFSHGLSAWWFTLGSGIAFILMGIFYARPFREAGLTTIPEYLTKNYGEGTGRAASVISSAGIFLSAVASALSGIGITRAVLGTGQWTSAAILTALVALYVFFGGMKSAGVGGMMKMAVIWLSLLIAGVAAFDSLPAGEQFHRIFDESWTNLFGAGVQAGLAQLASMIVGIVCTQTYVQAIFSASDPRIASIGAFVAALIVIPVGLPSVAIGMYMHAFAPGIPPLLALPAFLTTHVPPWLGGVALGGLMLSIIGSIGGLALGIGTMLTNDIIAPRWNIKDAAKRLLLSRAVVLAVVIAASAQAIADPDAKVLILNYLSMALRGGGIFLPLTLAVFRPNSVPPRFALASVLASTAVAAVFSTALAAPISPLFIGLSVSAAILLAGLWEKKRTGA